METNNHPTHTISFTNYQLDLGHSADLNLDARYALIDYSDWLTIIMPLLNANPDAFAALRASNTSGPHSVTVS